MRILKLYFLIVLSFLLVQNSYASCHVSDCDDAEFILLGKRFPAVGRFSSDSRSGTFGSGTLVDVGMPALNGRVVITCSHIFYDPDTKILKDLSQEEITFTLDQEAPQKGTSHVHPLYAPDDGISYDIAVFILDKPVDSILPAQIDWSNNVEGFLNKQYISAGFGITSHILGRYSIFDLHKRASYSHALPQYNSLKDIEFTERVEQYGQFSEKKIIEPKGSVLSLCPYVSSSLVDENNTLETCNKPAGLSDGGDSGGGCFGEDGQLVGVISQGSGFITRSGPGYIEKEFFWDNAYFSTYKEAIEKNTVHQNEFYESIRNSFEEKSKELEDFLAWCPASIQRPGIISPEETNALAKPYYDIKLFNTKDADRLHLCASHAVTLVSFHREWIMSTLEKALSDELYSREAEKAL